ncbi:hypothetical protein [Anabaena subtropica]|uniref:Uncharacterized protein n=1 Tax=Anabaena subtropica FACHB-260 TaxID=2692884 RepID=A0ABR8CSZ0_9NOST|nr:hypothetical protein [Anabaena subtropica]MBD2345658.1 hypothetical protein [Anabaena subtropica FACHB-260]
MKCQYENQNSENLGSHKALYIFSDGNGLRSAVGDRYSSTCQPLIKQCLRKYKIKLL